MPLFPISPLQATPILLSVSINLTTRKYLIEVESYSICCLMTGLLNLLFKINVKGELKKNIS